jgi:hypothetical protein
MVEVRSAAEILATLDDRGALEALPFMAEMIPYCGSRLTVESTAERMCDTIEWTGTRRIPDTVLLGQLRCDGSGHDGCQADCRLLWKAAWLRRVDAGAAPGDAPEGEDAARRALLALVAGHDRQPRPEGAPGEKYRCQTTELYRASAPASGFPYLAALTSGDVPLRRYLPVVARALAWETRRKVGGLAWSRRCFPGRSAPVRRPPLDLQPGDWVRIRSAREIEETIDQHGRTRGLWFDREMLRCCGRTARVKERIARFIHDDGTFVNFSSAAVKLESVTCSGDHSAGRYFCPRALYPFWREDWLERVDPPR